ncbi:MAG: right-handed parallel beta-helix repeat-containing protein [Verrucomicrobiales bacterium]
MTKFLFFCALLAAGAAFSRAEIVLKAYPPVAVADPAAQSLEAKTLEQILAEARELRRNNPQESITVELQDGFHPIKKPLIFTPDDSGDSPDEPFRFRAAVGATPIVSGGRILKGFKRDSENPKLWSLEIPEVKEGSWYFRDLFVNGKRLQRARSPNSGYYRFEGPSPQGLPVKIKYQQGTIKPEWVDAGDVELIALLAWADIRMQIRSVDETNRVATLSGNPRPSNRENNARYYIENARDALDVKGEFYLDRKSGVLNCLVEEGEDLSKAEVIAPVLTELVRIEGDFDNKKPVRNMVFSGIHFAHTGWTLPENGYADTQAAISIRGTVKVEGAENIKLENCAISHVAGYGIELGKGARNCAIIGNELFDLGAGGIRIGETAKRTIPFEQNHAHVITDNRIHNGGLVFPSAVGVFILQSGTNRVAHNHIHHLNYTAISVGWNWGYQETPCRENIIEFNHLHDIGQGKLSDMGAVYTLGIQKGTIIRNNRIHDVSSHGYGGWGLYPDEGSSEIVWENNLVYRCKSAGFHQHYGRENVVRNNIFALNDEFQLMRTREEDHVSFIFTNNIVYLEGAELLGSNWSNDKFVMENNLYFDANGKEIKFGKMNLAEWQKRGHDTNSMVADPLFVAPKDGNFTMKPESPAFKIGFKRIDLEKVGPRKNVLP